MNIKDNVFKLNFYIQIQWKDIRVKFFNLNEVTLLGQGENLHGLPLWMPTIMVILYYFIHKILYK